MSRVVGGRYKLLGEVGQGGMGTIWVAMDPVLERRVAIKIMHGMRQHDSEWLSRFHLEAQAVARLQHVNVISVYDFGIDADMPFTVMELLEGEDLQTRMQRQGSLSASATLNVVSGVAHALAAAHAAGIVHCDLKPANIFLSRTRTGECVKVLDFGVAWMTSSSQGAANQSTARKPAGTPAYMSPEQLTRGDIDHRADLWSLAVVAYFCLTGRLPFPQQSLTDLALNIQSGNPIPPSVHVPELTTAFDDFMTRGLAKAANHRFDSAQDFLTAFTAATELANADRPAKVLVVDDELDIEQLILSRFRREIRKRTYEIIFAHDGQEALDMLRQHPDVDVALVDINMPRMSGLTLLQRVTEIAPLLKVIMVSAYGDMANVRTAMRSGAFDFVVKPIDTADLQETMNKAIRQQRELSRARRSGAESQRLRMLANDGSMERGLPPSSATNSPVEPNESVDASVMMIRVHDIDAIASNTELHEVVNRMNGCLEFVMPHISAARGRFERYGSNAILISFQNDGHQARAFEASIAIAKDLGTQPGFQSREAQTTRGIGIGLSTGPIVRVAITSKTDGKFEQRIMGGPVSMADMLASCAFHADVLMCERMRAICNTSLQVSPQVVRTDAIAKGEITAYVMRGMSRVTVRPPAATTTDEVPSQYVSGKNTRLI